MRGRIPGFQFDARRHRARFEVILSGTGATRRRRKTVSAGTRDEALAKWKVWRERILGGEPSSDMTLAQYVDQIWPRTTALLAAKTVKREEWILRKHLLPRFGAIPLRAIRDAAVRDFVAELSAGGLRPATRNGIVALLGKFLRDAWQREIIPAVPVRRLPHQRVERVRLEFSPEEQEGFLAAFDDPAGFQRDLAKSRTLPEPVESQFFSSPRRFGGGIRPEGEAAGFLFQQFRRAKCLFVIGLETGLTRGDLLGLRWTSVNLQEGFIRVKRQKMGVEAVIPLSRACRAALEECRSRRVVGAHVFLTEAGKPYAVSVVMRHFQRAKRVAGITRRFRFHDLRHSLASRLASKGVSLQMIAMALGHASVRMAEGYARPSEAALEIVRKALDATPTSDMGSSDSRP